MPIHAVLSPLPGTFYRSPAPGEPAFKQEGDDVRPGEVIGLIEVMKQFSEVTAEVGGKLVKFHADNKAAVDAGMPLAEIDAP